MKTILPILVLFCALSVAGQITTIKNEIPESQYTAAVMKAQELRNSANYRSIWTKVYFEGRSKDAIIQAKTLLEVIQPDKRRTVDETFYEKPVREERIWVDNALYKRINDGQWQKYNGGGSGGGGIESGQVKNQYRFLPAVDFEGGKADFYEHISIRTANKASQNEVVTVRYVRTTLSWFSLDGKLLKKTQETTIDGREEMLRELTTYEYYPKNLKIEAPQLK